MKGYPVYTIPKPNYLSLSSDGRTLTCKKCWASIDTKYSNPYDITKFKATHEHPRPQSTQSVNPVKPWPVYPS